jgi:hypothetical protein
MTNRRDFIKQVSAAGILSSIPSVLLSQQNPSNNKIWACLLHLSFNMWEEYRSPESPEENFRIRGYLPDLQLSELLWSDALKKMAKEGLNMVVIDLGDAIKYESHPEIAVNNAWSTTRLRNELEKCRKMGLEPIPKLNFSSCHDTWLGVYSRMVSTEKYYTVCSDLIAEVIDLFDKPPFFHLGYDEEVAAYQSTYDYIVERQHDLWWHDFYFLIGEVEKRGSRPWIWSDYLWHHPDLFFKNMPKSVVQSNWYYGESFDEKQTYVKAYIDLEAHGYDQIPTGGYYESSKNIYSSEKSMLNTVQFCDERIANSRLLGFLQTLWRPTVEEFREPILKGIELTGNAKKWFDGKHK